MWPPLEWWLAGWTAAAAVWWALAIWLVRRRGRGDFVIASAPVGRASPRAGAGLAGIDTPRPSPGGSDHRSTKSLSIFKPLPPLRGAAVDELADAVESFVAQLDDTSELLLGLEEQDQAAWQPRLVAWRQRFPRARVHAVAQPCPRDLISPKVSWHHVLASRATGECWLWSDADGIAPPGFLAAIRAQFARGDAALITSPYVIRRARVAPMLFETLFVNVEFYPGALACERFGRVRFAFGAAMFFEAEQFRQRVGWEPIKRMAEDFVMGRELTPVRLSEQTVETLAAETRWRDALLHYLRWHKTVRWNRPAGFAGQLLIMPALGWLAAGQWPGLLATLALEAAVAWTLCRQAGCRLRPIWALWLPVWSLARVATWLVCWLPGPVVFRSQNLIWWSVSRSRRGAE